MFIHDLSNILAIFFGNIEIFIMYDDIFNIDSIKCCFAVFDNVLTCLKVINIFDNVKTFVNMKICQTLSHKLTRSEGPLCPI